MLARRPYWKPSVGFKPIRTNNQYANFLLLNGFRSRWQIQCDGWHKEIPVLPSGCFGPPNYSLFAAQAALERAGLPPEAVDEVIFGCARQAGNGPNIARQIAFHSGVPRDRPAFTVNKACAGGLKAITLAAPSVLGGEDDLVLAGGVEQMSQISYLLLRARWGYWPER